MNVNQQVVQTEEVVDVHKAIQDLHKSYDNKLKETTSDCEELFLCNRYISDLRELLKNCVKYFDRDERQMRLYYEQRIQELTEELERYKQVNGDLSLFTPEQEAVIRGIINKSSSVAKDKIMEGDDLRQTGDSNDLQSTCSALKSENDTLRAELESAKDKVREQAIKIEILTAGGEESAKKLKAIKEANLKAELVQRQSEVQQNFVNLMNDVTQKDAVNTIDGDSSGDSTIDMKLMEKNAALLKEVDSLKKQLKKYQKQTCEAEKKSHETEKVSSQEKQASKIASFRQR